MDIQLARQELEEIAKYTLQKIKNYPVECSKNIDDYFELLFEDEVMNYLVRRETNEKSSQFLLAVDCVENTNVATQRFSGAELC